MAYAIGQFMQGISEGLFVNASNTEHIVFYLKWKLDADTSTRTGGELRYEGLNKQVVYLRPGNTMRNWKNEAFDEVSEGKVIGTFILDFPTNRGASPRLTRIRPGKKSGDAADVVELNFQGLEALK